VDLIFASVPGRVRGARRGRDLLSVAEDALDAFHPQAQLAGDDLEALFLARMDVVRARGPPWLTAPINPQQLAACVLGGLTEHGLEPSDQVDQLVACFRHLSSSFADFLFRSLYNLSPLGPSSAGSPIASPPDP
jgi:hypothetical protein